MKYFENRGIDNIVVRHREICHMWDAICGIEDHKGLVKDTKSIYPDMDCSPKLIWIYTSMI
jgi:hypothetical protein